MRWSSFNCIVILEVSTFPCPPFKIFDLCPNLISVRDLRPSAEVQLSSDSCQRTKPLKIFLSQSSSIEHAIGHSSLDSSSIFVAYFVRPVPLKSSVGNLKLRNSFGRGFSGCGSSSLGSSLTSGSFYAIFRPVTLTVLKNR